MGNLLAELKRRQMFRVAAAYAVVAWLILQLVNNVAPVLDLPPWVARAFLLALVVGFPLALLFVWMRDLAPADAAAPRAATTRLDYVLAGGLVLVIALVSYQQFASAPPGPPAQRTDSSQPAAGSIAIAVLPFANLSGDAAQEFFSDGTSEEITAALAKVPGLRVVGRSSAFQFKGQNRDLRAIGQALNARFLIDGSVRQAGNRVRITAQLVQTDDGIGLWTESYDRELTDIFAIQEEIAQAIAGALRVPLGLAQGQSLVANRTRDLDTYQDYLRGRALIRARATGGASVNNATALLEQVVARDPDYAPAWAQLALAHVFTPGFSREFRSGSTDEFRAVVQASLPRAEAAAKRAIELDPNLADGYLSLARVLELRGKPLIAEEYYSKALALDPNNPEALNTYSQLLGAVGRLDEALRMKQRVIALEPFVPIYNTNMAMVLWASGQSDAAIAMLKPMAASPARAFALAVFHAAAGRYAEAADALSETPAGIYPSGMVEQAVGLLRTAPAAAAPQSLPPLLGGLEFVYLHVGASERTFDYSDRNIAAGYLLGNAFSWHPSVAPMRKNERFKAYMRAVGTIDYWRARGWPDLCRPLGADDFVCD